MAQWPSRVIDSDGHLIESIEEFAEYMDPQMRQGILFPQRQREGVFPSLGGFHGPRLGGNSAVRVDLRDDYVRASDHRPGSGPDYIAFVEQTGVEQSIMFTSEGLSVGLIRPADYAVRICRAYNDYVADKYRRLDRRLHPMALIPMQDAEAARQELRRVVKELDLPGAMIPSNGLPLHAGHEYYRPVYQEAAELDCTLGFHGGTTSNIGMDAFGNFQALAGLHHSIPLLIGLASLIGHGILDDYTNLRVGFFEGGAAWVVTLLDRMERNEEFIGGNGQGRKALSDYLASGRVLIGCEGNDPSLPHLVKRVGPEAFAWASDYPHEVDVTAAQRMIQDTVDDPQLTGQEKAAILGGNAARFFKLAEATAPTG